MIRREASLIDPDRRRFDISEVLLIGRSRVCDIVISSALVQRQHARLTRLPSDEIEVEDLGTTNGTYVNGRRITHQVLQPGDELDVVGQRFRFEQGPLVTLPPDEASLRVTAVWDDDAALQVVIDSLLEQGHPLGHALALGAPQALPPELDEAVNQRALVLEWRRGFVHEARLRPGPWLDRRVVVDALVRASAARFLRTLTLPRYEARLRLEATPLPTLEHLRFGPFFSRAAVESSAAALEKVTFSGM
ncbi:MAG TPA: FHA domain-containing protein, partial [Archangium sp.]